MKCINKNEVNAMKWLGKVMPYLVGAGIGIAIFYFWPQGGGPEIQKTVERMVETPTIELTEETEPERIYCPPAPKCPPVPECKPEIRYKTVYKDRIIHVPEVQEPGCRANWETGEVSASTVQGTNLKCVYDYTKRKIKTYFTLPDGYDGTLRRGQP